MGVAPQPLAGRAYLEEGLVLLDPFHRLLQEMLQGWRGWLRRICG